MDRLHLVPVARGLSDFEAKVVSAQLGAEGILWEMRGADAVYPLGNVDVLVPSAELDDARSVLLPATGVDDHGVHIGAEEPDVDGLGPEAWVPHRRRWWFVAAVLVAAATFFMVRMVMLGVAIRLPTAPQECGSHPESRAGALSSACQG